METPCTHCGGRKTFLTIAQHPRGAGHKVPCSRCGGEGVEKAAPKSIKPAS